MMSAADAVDIGRMLAWASRPRETPGRQDDYHRLVTRYREDPDFAATVDSVFAGAGLAVIVDPREGLLVTAEADSPLRVSVTDVMKRAQPQHRAVVGAVLLAVARTAYPDPALVDDPDRVAVFTTQSVVDTLDRAALRHAEASTDDSGIDEDLIEGWRHWLALAEARPNARRRSANDRPGLVNRICRFLTEVGYLTARGDTDGGTWLARARFRFAVAALCEDSELYSLVNGLVDGPPHEDDGIGHESDTGGSGSVVDPREEHRRVHDGVIDPGPAPTHGRPWPRWGELGVRRARTRTVPPARHPHLPQETRSCPYSATPRTAGPGSASRRGHRCARSSGGSSGR